MDLYLDIMCHITPEVANFCSRLLTFSAIACDVPYGALGCTKMALGSMSAGTACKEIKASETLKMQAAIEREGEMHLEGIKKVGEGERRRWGRGNKRSEFTARRSARQVEEQQAGAK